MQMRFFGDSHDIVKQSVVRWLQHFGPWSIHPMFTEPVSPADVAAFQDFLGAQVVSTDVLTCGTDRLAYLDRDSKDSNLLLDPDTGLCLRHTTATKARKYLFADELIQISRKRSHSLIAVFDQSVGRGSERRHLEIKLDYLRRNGVFAFAYIGQACFVIATHDACRLSKARAQFIYESGLPISRIVDAQGGHVKLYHRTTTDAAEAILAHGFRDASGDYLTDAKLKGVWVSEVPFGITEGVLLEIDLPLSESDLAGYEIPEEGKFRREWIIPAAVLKRGTVQMAEEESPYVRPTPLKKRKRRAPVAARPT